MNPYPNYPNHSNYSSNAHAYNTASASSVFGGDFGGYSSYSSYSSGSAPTAASSGLFDPLPASSGFYGGGGGGGNSNINHHMSSPYQAIAPPLPQNNFPHSHGSNNFVYSPNNSSFGGYPPASTLYPNPTITHQNGGGNYFHGHPTTTNNAFNQQPTPHVNQTMHSYHPQPAFVYSPTLLPHQPFLPGDDAAKLYKAMKGFGTDEAMLISILCKRTSHQRQAIALSYKSAYGKNLLSNLESETSGEFQITLRALMLTPIQLEAHDLNQAIQGFGTNEDAVIDILCTKTNAEMQELRSAYRQMFNKNMENEVKDDVSGYFKRFVVSLITGHRMENAPADPNRAAQLARELYDAGERQLGTNEVIFNRIFATESYAQLRLVFDEYQRIRGHPIEQAIRSEMSTSVERAFLAVAQMARNPASYYARRLYESMKGLGTSDRTLIRIMVLRSEKDMINIKTEFNRMHRTTLEAAIRADTSNDYRRALLCLAGDPRWK